MDLHKMISLLKQHEISETDVRTIRSAGSSFPYFSLPHLLIARESSAKGINFQFDHALQSAAIRINKRSSLYKLMIQPLARKRAEEVVEQIAPVLGKKLGTESEFNEIESLKNELEKSIVSTAVQASLAYDISSAEESKDTSSKIEISEADKPAKRSFSSWISILENESPKIDSEIIDQFIEVSKERDIRPFKFFKASEDTKTSLIDDESFVTETLARVYSDQGLFEKAIQVYDLLSLKYPQKSSYFAALIKELKDNTIE